MFAHLKNKGSALVVASFLAVGVLAGGVLAAQWHAAVSPDELGAALSDAHVVRIADIPADSGYLARGVFAQKTSGGLFCLWDAPSASAAERQGGCNPSDDPLGGRMMFVSFAYDGGPAVGSVRDARLIGLTAAAVASVEVVMSDGTRRTVELHKTPSSIGNYLAFGLRFGRGGLRRGTSPTAVVAFDGAGSEIDRQVTGFH